MPEKKTLERARADKRAGKSPSTQAGEFVREEMHHIREGKHGAESTKQAIAIGLSKARRAGVDLPSPPEESKERTKESAESAVRRRGKKPSPKRSRATRAALKREGQAAASSRSLARQARSAARRRSAADRSKAARKADQRSGRAQGCRAQGRADPGSTRGALNSVLTSRLPTAVWIVNCADADSESSTATSSRPTFSISVHLLRMLPLNKFSDRHFLEWVRGES
jgi:hypothetical protein